MVIENIIGLEARKIIREIEEVFPSCGLDGGISLRQALLDDDWESDDPVKMKKAYEADVTHDWKAIPEEELAAFFDSFSVFSYLDDKGWKYYLPAALEHALKMPDSPGAFYTVISLLPVNTHKELGLPEWNQDNFQKHLELTCEQGRAVIRALMFFRKYRSSMFAKDPERIIQLESWIERFFPNNSAEKL